MHKIEDICLAIHELAKPHFMAAYLSPTESGDGPVIKICVRGAPNKILLVLHQKSRLELLEHRNAELTKLHKGRAVSLKWLSGFFKSNEDSARIEAQSVAAARSNPTPYSNATATEHPKPLSPAREKSVISLATPRGNWVLCQQCGGDGGPGGRCPRCGGNGFEPIADSTS